MQKKHDKIKIKVIGWFLLAALAVILTGVISYNSYRQLLGSLDQTITQETKLKALGDILANITEAEAKMRAYGLTKEPDLLDTYQQLVISINEDLDSLKSTAPVDANFNDQVDSVSQLLHEQTTGITAFIELRNNLNQLSFSTKALLEISSTTDSIPTLRTTKTTTTTTTRVDPLIQAQEIEDGKKNTKRQQRRRVQEIAKTLSKLEQEPQIETETVTTVDTSFLQSDTLLDNIQQILIDLSEDENRYQQLAADRELALIESSIVIIDQIRGLISSLEKQELALNMEQANSAKLIASRSTLTISLIIIICLVLGILFIYWIFRDVRISDFYNRQLLGAKQEAEQLADSKQQFLANMSHEIRTPLNAIIGFTEQLSGTSLETTQREYLQAVQTSSQHLLNTVNDILDYSKIEAGELRIDKVPFELRSVLEDVVKALRLNAEKKNLDLKLTGLPDEPVYVVGDPFRLKQILFNLISNGVKFTEEGYVKVKCSFQKRKSVLTLEIAVEDSGIGIPEDKRAEVFDDFKQIDPSANRRYQGTGLGLAICKRLVDMLGGSIRIEENKPHGTVFLINLEYTVSQEPEEHIGLKDVTKTVVLPSEGPLKDLKILVADDDPFNIQLIKSLLDKWGAETVSCTDGKQAMNLMESHLFQLLLTDINMPEVGGVELSHFVRSLQDPEKNKIPIIALTANVMEDHLEKYKLAGINGFVLKPFKKAELLDKIREFMPKQSPAETTKQAEYLLADLKKFSGGDDQALKPMLETFHENLKQNMEALSLHARNNQPIKVAELAHKMISSFGHVHAMEPVKMLRELESALKSDVLEEPLEVMVDRIIEVSEPILEGLQQEIEILG